MTGPVGDGGVGIPLCGVAGGLVGRGWSDVTSGALALVKAYGGS